MSSPRVPRMDSGPFPNYAAPSISGWIAGSAGRHSVTLAIATLVIVIADAFGASVDARAYATMGAWIGVNFVVSRWAVRPASYPVRLWRYAWSLVVDVLFLAATYFFIDAAHYLGAVFFAHMALIASATLPRRWAMAIAALIVTTYTGLAALAVFGPHVIPSPIGLPPVTGNRLFLVASVASVVGMVVLLMHLQARLIKSIRDAEQRYISVVQSASDMVMTFDQEGRFIDANAATVEQSGYSWEEIKRLPNTGFFPADDWPAVMAAFKRTLDGESVRLEVRYVRKDGAERWVQTSAFPITVDAKPATVVIARDVTDAYRKHQEMRERDERLSLVLDALGAGFVTFDRDLRITSAVGEWARVREAAGERLVGARIAELAGAADTVEQHGQADERVLRGERVSVAWTLALPSGDQRRMRSHIVPLHDAAGAVVGGAGLWVDETDLVQAEQEREQLRQRVADADRIESLGKLVSGVAHELNNPLAAILNFTEDLLADARTPEERLALEVIQAQALRSRTIVRDLLTYARRDVARPRTPLAPGPILQTLARAMRPGFAAQGVTFAAEIAPDAPPVLLDRTGFEQVVTNLLTNAAHAAGSGGSIRLSSRVRGEMFEVLVEDNGGGVPPDLADRIFEPFFTTKPTGQGVGLGLSVSAGIVTAHGGTLSVQNRPEAAGGGARFTMRLPIAGAGSAQAATPAPEADAVLLRGDASQARAAQEPVTEPASQPRAMPERRRTILIIDDESAIRQGLKRYFTRKGWVVEESADGADALAKLLRPEAARIYDAVLCDLKMAGVSGMDVYDRMCAVAPKVAQRFILSTGDTSAPDVSGFLSQVTVPVLEKPFELTALEQLAEQVRSGAGASAPGDPGPA